MHKETLTRISYAKCESSPKIVLRADFLIPAHTHASECVQRGPLEYTFFKPFPKLVFGCIKNDFCVQGPILQHFSKATFFPLHHSRFLIFQDLCTIFHWVNAIFTEFQERQQILQIFVKLSPNFCRVPQSFSDVDSRSDVKMMIFHRNLIEFAEINKTFVAKNSEDLSEKNVYSNALRW